MLKIVGDTCVGTVLGASPDHNGSKNLGLRVVLVQPNGHAVAQFQLLNIQLCRSCDCDQQCSHRENYSSHKQIIILLQNYEKANKQPNDLPAFLFLWAGESFHDEKYGGGHNFFINTGV
jgi:hypothetical protein